MTRPTAWMVVFLLCGVGCGAAAIVTADLQNPSDASALAVMALLFFTAAKGR